MDILNIITELLEKEELRNYKLMATRSHPGDRKDIELLEYMRKSGRKFNERKIIKQLFGTVSPNRYYRLKNRLLEDVSKSLVLLHWDRSEFNKALHYLVLGVLYREKQQFKVAHYMVRRAEKIAILIGKPELLDLIYGEHILLSLDMPEINPEKYISLRTENLQTLNRLRQIDNILAAITYRIKTTQNFGARDNTVLDLLQKTIEEYSNEPDLMNNPQFRYRMYNAVSKMLLQRQDFVSLESYLLRTYQEFNHENLFSRSNHDTRLQMLTYLINALYKNGKREESLAWSARLIEAMKEHNRLYYEKYLFFYFNAQVMNYSDLDPERALRILEEMMENETLAKVPTQAVYIHVNLAISNYKLGKLRPAVRNLVRLSLLDAFASTDAEVKLQVALFELGMRFELQEIDVLETRLSQCRREFAELLALESHEKEREAIRMLEALAASADPENDAELKAQAQAFVEKFEDGETEMFKFGEMLTRRLHLSTR